MVGIGDGEGAGRVIGGWPATTGGGVTGEIGGAMVTGGGAVVVGGSAVTDDLVEIDDGPIGFELLSHATANSGSETASTIDES